MARTLRCQYRLPARAPRRRRAGPFPSLREGVASLLDADRHHPGNALRRPRVAPTGAFRGAIPMAMASTSARTRRSVLLAALGGAAAALAGAVGRPGRALAASDVGDPVLVGGYYTS